MLVDIAVITGLVSNLGFPIVCAGALGFFMYKAWIKIQAQNEKREEKLYQEISEGRRINEKFADIISTYSTKLDNIQSDVKDIKERMDK